MGRHWKATLYVQQNLGATYHMLWMLGHPRGIRNDFTKSSIMLRDLGPRQFTKGNHYTIYGPGYVWVRLNHQKWPS